MTAGRGAVVLLAGSDSPVRAASLIRSDWRLDEAQVGRDDVAGVEPDDVTGHELRRRDDRRLAAADDPGRRARHPLERVHRLLGPVLLDEADDPVEDDDGEDDDRVLQVADRRRDDRRPDEDEDHRVRELLGQEAPGRLQRPGAELVRAVRTRVGRGPPRPSSRPRDPIGAPPRPRRPRSSTDLSSPRSDGSGSRRRSLPTDDQDGRVGVEEDVPRDAAEKPPVQTAEAARPGHDEVSLGVRGSLDDLVRRVAVPHHGLRLDADLRQSPSHRRGVLLMALEELIAMPLQRVVAQGVQGHHQLEARETQRVRHSRRPRAGPRTPPRRPGPRG